MRDIRRKTGLFLVGILFLLMPVSASSTGDQKVNIEYVSQTEDNHLIIHFNSDLEHGIIKDDTTVLINHEEVDGTMQAFSDSEETMSYFFLLNFSTDADKRSLSVAKTILKEIVSEKKAGDTVDVISAYPVKKHTYHLSKKAIRKQIDEVRLKKENQEIFRELRSILDSDFEDANLRKRIIVCTDGKGKKDKASYDSCMAKLQKSNIPVDVVCISNPMSMQTMQMMTPSENQDLSGRLEKTAEQSAGGCYYSMPLTGDHDKKTAIDAIASPICSRIDNSISYRVDLSQYGIGYGMQTVEVSVTEDDKTYSDTEETEMESVAVKAIDWSVVVTLLITVLAVCLMMIWITRSKRRKVAKPVVSNAPVSNSHAERSESTAPSAGLHITIASLRGMEERTITGNSTIVVGRSAGADVSIPYDPHLSNRHCRLQRQGDQVMVTDLNSQNGTWLRGQRITGTCELQKGDILSIGQTQIGLDWR